MDGSGMSGGKKGRIPDVDLLDRSCSISVEGSSFDEMVLQAKIEAATLLHRPISDLYVSSHTHPQIGSVTRFRKHLGDPPFVETWVMSVRVSVKHKESDDASTTPAEY